MIVTVTSISFPLGQTAITPGALDALEACGKEPQEYLRRHHAGDWGDVSPGDAEENELSLKNGFRLLSAYQVTKDYRLYVITEADRSATTLLLSSEY